MAFFCNQTGVRIAAPGVSKSVDPVNGQDEVVELADGTEAPVSLVEAAAAAATAPATTNDAPPTPAEPPAAPPSAPATTNDAPPAESRGRSRK